MDELFDQLFELNNLKAKLQENDTTIKKFKENIKRLNKNSTTNSVKKVIDEIETINMELEHRVAKLIAENKHLKQTYKQLSDSIKPSRVRVKEHIESLVNQLNQKSVEITNLNAQLQEKVFVITSLKNDLRKLKGKDIVDNVAQVSNATELIVPELKLKLDPVTLAPKDKNNREAHIYYLKHTMEQAAILREIVKQAKLLNPLDSAFYYAFAVTPINKKKIVRFVEPVISSSTSQKQLGSSQTQAKQITNNSVLTSTRVNRSTKSSRSKSTDKTKNDWILQISSSTYKKNKVEDHSGIVKSCLNKSNCVVEPSRNANVQHSKLNTNSELMCVKCNSSMFDARHELCFIEFVSDMNACSKSKFVKKAKKKEEWKPTGKVFTKIRYNWRPTGRTFTLVGNTCPLTRITATNKVPFKEPIPLEVVAQESVVTKVYTRRPKVPKTNGSNSKPKIAKSMISKKQNSIHLRDPIFQLLHLLLLLSISDLEVAFRKHTCFVRNLEGIDLLSRSQEINLYTLSIGDMMASSPICLLSKASKTKSCLPKLKFEKDHLCSACAMGKSKKQSHKPRSEDTNQEKLYLLHMDLCGPMHVASINGKMYILIIVDDYSRFTWVKFLASKDEASDFIIKKLDLSYLHVFGALFYPNNDSEDLGKLQAKADIGIFIGYAPEKKAYFPIAAAPRAVDLADSPVSTSIDQNAPSASIPSTQDQEHSPIISQRFEESPKTPYFHDDPLHESLHEDSTS
ncbi:retrovirus-related pol polyprotein from transposon TNT 1-94 [Tanacetum coccineum]